MDKNFSDGTKHRLQGECIINSALATIDFRSFTKQNREEKV